MSNINLEMLRMVMKDFHTLTHIRIAVLDCDIQELIAYPPNKCAFCDFIRQQPRFDKRCRECDIDAFRRSKNNNAPHMYSCHAGLTEIIIPIRKDDRVLCYVMFGQILHSESAESQREAIFQKFSGQGLDEEALRSAIAQIDHRSEDVISAAMTILESLTIFFLSKQYILPSFVRFVDLLDQYIDEHLQEKIRIADLCAHFYVSRTRLYELMRPYLNCGLSDYVLHRRLLHAMQMLSETEKPISEISDAVGFSDYNYFRRIFKQKTGLSAKEYRKQNQHQHLLSSAEQD